MGVNASIEGSNPSFSVLRPGHGLVPVDPGIVAPVTWTAFIEHAPSAEHAVHLYQEPEELGRSVATFLDAGFRIGAPGIVVATPEHWQVFARELQSRGCDLEPLEREGQLTVLDADTLLATF